MPFSGRWFTSFGPMLLQESGGRIAGTYGATGSENTIEGSIDAAGVFTFRYQEPMESGTGWFRLKRYGAFAGQYLAHGTAQEHPWQGWRELEGCWDTSLGRMRLLQERNHVQGVLEFDPAGRLEGRLEDGRLTYSFAGTRGAASGFIDFDPIGQTLQGEWRQDGLGPHALGGRRCLPRPGLNWLVVLEAHWQRSLEDTEFAFGSMLRELFARVPRSQVRHRFFQDEASLLHWCRQLMFLPEPAVLVVTGHGEADGLSVNGRILDLRAMIDTLRLADSLQLLHFSACLVGQDAGQALAGAPFPISGYTTRVDWAESALTEFIYLDMILEKRLPPAKAAEQLLSLVRFAGDEPIPGSPYQPAGFRFFPASDRPGTPSLAV